MTEYGIGRPAESSGFAAGGCRAVRGWKTHLMRLLVRQFGRPRGFLGRVAGQIMAKRPSNVERNLWTLELLEIRPSDRVLEIGFGPGIAVAAASRLATGGLVVGIDHSEIMLRQAARINSAAIRSGSVDLRLGSVGDLPIFEQPFHKIYAVNSVAFWDQPVERLAELRGLLTPDGVIAITEQPRLQSGSDGATGRAGDRIAAQLRQAGFKGAQMDIRSMKPSAAVCVRGWIQVGGSAGDSSSAPGSLPTNRSGS